MTAIPVCVFAKAPVAGKVKTRLAQAIGGDAAAELASAMLRDVWSVVSGAAAARPILATAGPGLFPIAVSANDTWAQGRGELGTRIASILRRGLQQAPAAIAVGADAPLLTAGHLKEAITALRNHDAVIGPSPDGGFYLLGVRRCPDHLFDGVPWSSPETAEKTLERLSAFGMIVSHLSPLGDVDTFKDLHTLREQLPAVGSEVAPATRAWFESFRLSLP